MATQERTIYRYGDFPELFWDLRREAEVDGTNPAIVARLLEHAPPETIWELVPVDVLLRDFEKLDLPENTQRFWSIVVGMMRTERGLKTPSVTSKERGIIYRVRPRFHPDSDRPAPIPRKGVYQYGDLTELFWDRPPNAVVDGSDPEVIARLLENAPPELVWNIVDVDVLLHDFETLDLPDHTRRFWALIVDGMRETRGTHTESQSAA